jgi:hypothetical protein
VNTSSEVFCWDVNAATAGAARAAKAAGAAGAGAGGVGGKLPVSASLVPFTEAAYWLTL